jgi:hypothetical protein
MEATKTNTQLLREIQDVVDELNVKKNEVESLLQVIDVLELKYYNLVEEVKNNSAKK